MASIPQSTGDGGPARSAEGKARQKRRTWHAFSRRVAARRRGTGHDRWFAIGLGTSEFAIFDAFPHDSGRQAHLTGRVAEALIAQAPELFAEPPEITSANVIAAKLPR
jgi:hypothetical protein